MVFFSDNASMVNPTAGSWFVQTILEVFRRHYKKEHVADMMTVVNLVVAELRGKLLDGDGKSYVEAIQMPCIVSTLRKRFYLYHSEQIDHV
jgi:hypothetical protein